MDLRKYPLFFSIFALLFFSAMVSAKKHDQATFPNVKIKNFGQLDDRFYRGGQPKETDYKSLADLGIKTVIDLREDSESYEKHNVEALGMHYVNIPMSDTTYPRAEQIEQFLKLVNDSNTGKFFVHCAGGRHRTGVMGAVYRFNFYKWNFDQVYAEMKDYDFYTRWGHGDMKKFVEDYSRNFQSSTPGVVPASSGVASAAAAGAKP
jgi:protein tyrosine/serine phosphatase